MAVAHVAADGRGVSLSVSQSVSLREKFTVAGFHRKRERSERASARARLLREKEETNGLGRAGTDTILEEEA